MGLLLRSLVMLLGLGLLVRVIFGIKKNKLTEWQAMLWIVAAIALIVLGAFPSIVIWAAGLLDVVWPPAIVFLAAIVILSIICFNYAQEISVMRSEISEQAMLIALMRDQLKQMENKIDALNGENVDEHSDLR